MRPEAVPTKTLRSRPVSREGVSACSASAVRRADPLTARHDPSRGSVPIRCIRSPLSSERPALSGRQANPSTGRMRIPRTDVLAMTDTGDRSPSRMPVHRIRRWPGAGARPSCSHDQRNAVERPRTGRAVCSGVHSIGGTNPRAGGDPGSTRDWCSAESRRPPHRRRERVHHRNPRRRSHAR